MTKDTILTIRSSSGGCCEVKEVFYWQLVRRWLSLKSVTVKWSSAIAIAIAIATASSSGKG